MLTFSKVIAKNRDIASSTLILGTMYENELRQNNNSILIKK